MASRGTCKKTLLKGTDALVTGLMYHPHGLKNFSNTSVCVCVCICDQRVVSVFLKVWYSRLTLGETQMTKFNMRRYKLIGSFPELWMDLETVIQSEVSQKEKKIYINTYVESRKVVQMHLFAGQEERRRCREQMCRPRWKGSLGWTGRLGLTYIHYHV